MVDGKRNSDNMNLPNKLTLGRMASILVIVIISVIPAFQSMIIFGSVTLEDILILAIFILASFTDYLDGHIARSRGLVTTFGKFMDPLADKLLVMTTLLILLERGRFTVFGTSLSFAVILILAREFMVTGIRLLAASSPSPRIIAANIWGKAKTVSQMVMIVLLLLDGYPFTAISARWGDGVKLVLIALATALTIISGVKYFLDSKDIILESK